ncbi:tyrosine-type recombinase/integrase [Xanthobacter sp. DSM 24535]|uniref:tyrosine-type recombinase/integrase n=1 Tax=Roseixanthobacter psychrophilus TaxID=3119917 RepID=UPI0037270140
MTRVRLTGINKVKKLLADGSTATYHYHRATGLRLEGDPGSPEFIISYAKAEATVKARHSGETFNALIRSYTGSIEFEQKLAASTRTEYKRMLTKAEPEFGGMPLAALSDPRVRKDFLDWREKIAKASGQREADNRLSAISAMLTWAVDRGTLTVNYLKGFKRLYHSDRSEIIWFPEHIEAFWKVAPIEMQRALIIALHTGQRQGDILRMPWSAYDGTEITLRQGKRRRNGNQAPPTYIPCTSALRRMLDGMERKSLLILSTKTGRALQKRYFARQWEEATKAAGLDAVKLPGLDEPVSLHFHDLRGTAVTMLSEAGCTPQQIAPITGHSVKTVHVILERYLARTRGLAEQAIFNFENSPRTKFANQLQTVAPAPRARKG